MRQQKGFLSVWALLLVAIGITAAALVMIPRPTSSPIVSPVPSVARPTLSASPESDISTWKTYRNDQYGFEMKYPPVDVVKVVESGPDSYELNLEAGKQISGTQAPLLENISFMNKFGETVLAIDVPNHMNFDVVTGDYNWWPRLCGQEEFAEIRSKENILFAGQKTLWVISIFEADNPSKEQTYFYCINHQKNPIIISYQKTTFGYIVEPILSTFRFLSPAIINKTDCEASGGRWGRFGVASTEYCDMPPWDQ